MTDFELRCKSAFPVFLHRLGTSEFKELKCGPGWNPSLEKFFDRIECLNAFQRKTTGGVFELVAVCVRNGLIFAASRFVHNELTTREHYDAVWRLYDLMLDELKIECAKQCEMCGKIDPVFSRKEGRETMCAACAEEVRNMPMFVLER